MWAWQHRPQKWHSRVSLAAAAQTPWLTLAQFASSRLNSGDKNKRLWYSRRKP